ncbi:hypothetical protein ACIPUB_18175 [Paeniglutamicibacter sp. ORCA_105]|uniref:hypothetical protein n=1 Tax=Paeniglutamicibacter sp. ORCA_105 TaxID=3377336 RepID=UPI003895BF9C
MKTRQHHQAPHTTNRGQSARPISQPDGFVQAIPVAGIPEDGRSATETREEEVRFHFVATRQPADPAQIPWLDEISGSHDVNEASSGII